MHLWEIVLTEETAEQDARWSQRTFRLSHLNETTRAALRTLGLPAMAVETVLAYHSTICTLLTAYQQTQAHIENETLPD